MSHQPRRRGARWLACLRRAEREKQEREAAEARAKVERERRDREATDARAKADRDAAEARANADREAAAARDKADQDAIAEARRQLQSDFEIRSILEGTEALQLPSEPAGAYRPSVPVQHQESTLSNPSKVGISPTESLKNDLAVFLTVHNLELAGPGTSAQHR